MNITANIAVPSRTDDAHIPAKLRSTVSFFIEAVATHHYEAPSSVCDGEDWIEIEEITYLGVEFDRPPEDGEVNGWYEWEITDSESARKYLAAWGVDVDELADEEWTGKDSPTEDQDW